MLPLAHHRDAVRARLAACLRRGGPNLLHIGPLPEAGALAARLCALAGSPFSVALLATSDGDALDNALKLARAASGRTPLLATPAPRAHAASFGARALEPPLEPPLARLGDVHPVAADAEALARALAAHRPAALVLSPVDDALRPLSAGVALSMEALCRQTGALLIVDETLTGLGRCGARFAFQALGLRPDAVVVGQSLGAGAAAIAATVVTEAAHARAFGGQETFDLHTATMAGNALACEAALGMLDALDQHDLAARAARGGELLRAALAAAGAQVTGQGLLLRAAWPDGRVQVLTPPLDATDDELRAAL